MSNHSLIEFNHDHAHMIDRDPEGFIRALKQYLASGQAPIVERSGETQRRFIFSGVRVFGMRHHSEGFNIEWGYHKAGEKASPQ